MYVNLEMLGSAPFTQEVDEVIPPKGFKLLTMETYNRSIDPIDHLEMFRTCPSKEPEIPSFVRPSCNTKEGREILVLLPTTKVHLHL